MPIYGSSFGRGLEFGRQIFNDAESNRRANAADARAGAEEKRRQGQADREEMVRQQLGNSPEARSDYQALENSAAVPTGGYTPAPAAPATTNTGLPVATNPSAPVPTTAGTGVNLDAIAAATAQPAAQAPAPAAAPATKIMPWVEQEDQAKEYARQAKILRNNGDVRSYSQLMDKSTALKKEAAYTKFGHELVGMSDEDLAKKAKPWVSDNKDAPAMLRYDKKSGSYEVIHDNGEVQQFNSAQIRTLMLSAFEMGNGDVAAGVQKQLEVFNQRQQRTDTRADKENAITKTIGDNENTNRRLDMQERNAWARLAISERGANARAARAERPQLVMLADAKDGEPRPVWMSPGGKAVEVELPAGLKFPKSKDGLPTRKELTDAAKAMVDSGAKNQDGKPMQFDEAYEAAQSLFAGKGTGGGVEVDFSKIKLPPKGGVKMAPPFDATIMSTPQLTNLAANPNVPTATRQAAGVELQRRPPEPVEAAYGYQPE